MSKTEFRAKLEMFVEEQDIDEKRAAEVLSDYAHDLYK